MAVASSIPVERKKRGRGFFLFLLILSGLACASWFLISFKGRDIFLFLFKTFVVDKALVQDLPKEYTLEEVEKIRLTLHSYMDAGKRGDVSNEELLSVMGKTRAAIADNQVTRDEVKELMTLMKREH